MEKVKLSRLVPDEKQPRQEFEPDALKRLEESISREGILQPLIVEEYKDGKYLIVDGERRYRTAKALELKEVPVIIVPPMTEFQRLVRRFNIQEQHQSWGAFDKARAISMLKDFEGMTVAEISNILGLSQSTVDGYISLLSLSRRSMEMAITKKIPFSYLKGIARTVRNLESQASKTKIENLLIDQVVLGVITTHHDLAKFKRAFQANEELMLTKFSRNPQYMASQAIKDTGVDVEMTINRYMITSKYLTGLAKKMVLDKTCKNLTSDHISTLEKLKDVIDQMISNSGSTTE